MKGTRVRLRVQRSRVTWPIVAGALFVAFGAPAFAQQSYYRWVDEKGGVHYSQFPPPVSEAAPPTSAPSPATPPMPPSSERAPQQAPAGKRTSGETPIRIRVSRETTFLVTPLRADGTVDYAAAWNARHGRGVTPDNNAAVPLIRALGPRALLAGSRAEILKRLGMPAPPEKGDYWTGSEPAETQKALRTPWQASEYPVVAAWLKANEGPLALVAEASKRSRFWIPAVENKAGSISPTTLSANVGQIGRALVARAMRKLQSGDTAGAWSDLVAGQRLGRLVSHRHTVGDLLLGAQLERSTSEGVGVLARSRGITAAQARAFLSDLSALPPSASVVEVVNQFERLIVLSLLTPRGEMDWEVIATLLEAPGLGRLSSSHIEWDETLRTFNQCWDRSVAVFRKPRFTARREAAAVLGKELEAAHNRARRTFGVQSVDALLRTGPDAASRAALGRALGQLYCAGVDAMGLWVNVEARVVDSAARLRLNQVALALAAYRAEKSGFPARLAELSPGYLAAVPKDPFTDRALSYGPRGAGYLLYSVGPDQKPDTAAGAKTGDDIVVRAE